MRGVIQLFTEILGILGLRSLFSGESGNIKWAVPFGRSDLFLINGVDGLGFVLFHEVNLGPVVSSLSVAAGFILLDSLPAFFLLVSLEFAEVAVFAFRLLLLPVPEFPP